MTIKLKNFIEDRKGYNNFSEEVLVLSETTSGANSVYAILNKNGVTMQLVPGTSGITATGFLGFVNGDRSRPVLMTGTAKNDRTLSNVASVWSLEVSLDPTPLSLSQDAANLKNAPTANFNGTTLHLRDKISNELMRTFMKWDFGDVSTLNTATLRLWLFAPAITEVLSTDIVRVTRSDWTETGVTWNEYKSGFSWTTPGGDFTAVDKVTKVQNFTTGVGNYALTWDLTTLAQDALDNRSGVLDIMLKFTTEPGAGLQSFLFASRSNIFVGDNTPQLILT